MTVDLDDAAVDHSVFKVSVFGQRPEHSIESNRVDPSAELLEDRVPLPEIVWQVAPRAARACNSQHSLNEQPRIRAGSSRITLPAKTMRSNDGPLGVGQCSADQSCLPFGNLESLSHGFVNPQTSTDTSYKWHNKSSLSRARLNRGYAVAVNRRVAPPGALIGRVSHF